MIRAQALYAKLDPETWEVVAEYPYTGYRGDWIIIDSNGEGRVVRDQGGFHNGVHPARGSPLVLAEN